MDVNVRSVAGLIQGGRRVRVLVLTAMGLGIGTMVGGVAAIYGEFRNLRAIRLPAVPGPKRGRHHKRWWQQSTMELRIRSAHRAALAYEQVRNEADGLLALPVPATRSELAQCPLPKDGRYHALAPRVLAAAARMDHMRARLVTGRIPTPAVEASPWGTPAVDDTWDPAELVRS